MQSLIDACKFARSCVCMCVCVFALLLLLLLLLLFLCAGFGGGEAAKAQRHLTLLRQEYVKLQQKHAELEQKYSIVASAAGHLGTDHYVTRLMHTIEELFDREHFR